MAYLFDKTMRLAYNEEGGKYVREDAITQEDANKRGIDRIIRGRVSELVAQVDAQRSQRRPDELRRRSGVQDEGLDEGKAWETSEVTGDPLFNFKQSYEDFIREATGDNVFGEPTKSLPDALTDQDRNHEDR